MEGFAAKTVRDGGFVGVGPVEECDVELCGTTDHADRLSSVARLAQTPGPVSCMAP